MNILSAVYVENFIDQYALSCYGAAELLTDVRGVAFSIIPLLYFYPCKKDFPMLHFP